MYQLIKGGVLRLSDNAFIPADSANSDYQQFLTDQSVGVAVIPQQPSAEHVWNVLTETWDIDRQLLIAKIKEERKAALDRFPKNSVGVSRIYSENLSAARKFQASDVAPMADGQTPTAYLAGLGVEMGMSAAAFAQYVIDENARLGPSVFDIEKSYLATSRVALTEPNTATVLTTFDNFKAQCASVIGE